MASGRIRWIMKLFSQNRWTWALAHLFCTSVFLVQLFQLLPGYIAPTMTYTEVENVQLKDIDFPLDFEICVKPLFISTALHKFGYLSPYHYNTGANSDNTLIGWGGHSNNPGALTSAQEVLIETRMNVTKNLLGKVGFSTYGGIMVVNLTDMVTLDKINWQYECFTLNLSKIRKSILNGMEAIAIYFNRSDDIVLKNNFSVELRIRGKTLASRREIQKHRLYASGHDVMLSNDDVNQNQFPTYIVKIEKNVFVEEDRTKNCRKYPNLDFTSYKDCDFEYMKSIVKENSAGMNLIPPWLTDDLENVTTKPVKLQSNVSFQLGRLVLGMATSDCPLPCTTISTETRLTDKSVRESFGFAFQFQQAVQVRKTTKFFDQLYMKHLGDHNEDDDPDLNQLLVRRENYPPQKSCADTQNMFAKLRDAIQTYF